MIAKLGSEKALQDAIRCGDVVEIQEIFGWTLKKQTTFSLFLFIVFSILIFFKQVVFFQSKIAKQIQERKKLLCVAGNLCVSNLWHGGKLWDAKGSCGFEDRRGSWRSSRFLYQLGTTVGLRSFWRSFPIDVSAAQECPAGTGGYWNQELWNSSIDLCKFIGQCFWWWLCSFASWVFAEDRRCSLMVVKSERAMQLGFFYSCLKMLIDLRVFKNTRCFLILDLKL